MAKTETQQHNPGLIAVIAVPLALAALWFHSAAAATSWALSHGYFTTGRPLFALPGANPSDAGPTLLAVAALAAIALGIVAAVMVGIRMAAPVQHDPDDRRPVPPVAAPVLAVTALTGGLFVLALIPFVPDIIAAAIGIIAAYGLADLLTEKLCERRERARYLNEIEWALYPYLGYDELPRRRLVAITEWDEEVDGQPEKPKTIVLAYRGRREELKPELSRRLDDAVGSHYTLSYATTDQLITATLASVNTESPTVRGLREQIASTELFSSGATITDPQYSESGDLVRFTVHHQIGAKLSGTDRIRSIARKISDLLPGRWRATRYDHLAGTAVFEIRPELPSRVYPPIQAPITTVKEACSTYDHAAIPLAVDEEGNIIEWNLKVHPHMLLMGPTGTGKTATLHNTIVQAARLGIRIFIIDFKGGEFTSYRTYPNVVAVLTEPHEAIALVNTLYKEMQGRYNLYKRNRQALAGKEPFVIIFDEYTEFQEAMKTFYANTKEKGAQRDCPTLRQFSALLRLGRTSRFHCVAALQRADVEFLKGEAKENFRQRLSLGKLSPQAAMMIHDDAHAGRTVPLGVRGRGTALNGAGWPTEVQAFYVPDPSEPADQEEKQIVDELRPPAAIYERGIIMPPEADPNTEPQGFSSYQNLPLLKAADYPQFDPHSDDYAPPEWLDVHDRGVESIFGSAPGGPRPLTPTCAQELVCSYEESAGESRRVVVGDLEVGDYLCHPTTGDWVILDEEPTPGEDPDTTVLILRDVYTGEREEAEVASDATVEVRDLVETHLTSA
ncbi:type IV secretion system DNA-binding domain-containing protein [Mycobacterium simiae]|uniref:Type IV secretion system DNA-binding domain-containing protein n=1 Tax=Mycobacterium simiae TaxID=1784 RepID=A0A5B1BU87_MYCSI|nr:FtsK/SpoIIIE domain-containing protein [Mycobacterium simiae]KAA1250699.1 type IV secretion system DNA-binding domain-containing protein [Mycobacterium simiae]